jgi:predicted kinase
MSSPKEKAEEIVSKYTNMFTVFIPAKNTIKQCALIAVDEIRNILSMPNIPKYYPIVTDEYWEQVKQEIEKL